MSIVQVPESLGAAEAQDASRAKRLLARLRRVEPGLVLAWLIVAVAIAWSTAPALFTSYSPVDGIPRQRRQPPGALHWFGTDELGRDLYARVVHGAVHTLSGAMIAVAVGLVIGTLIGVIAGSVGRRLDDAIMRLIDVMLAVPVLLLTLSIIIILGFGTVNAAIAVGVASVARFARLARSEVVRVRRMDYVEAAFGNGGRFFSVLWRHVLPNSLTAVLGLAAVQVGYAIILISTLGFLGYGAPPPTPEWGLLIADGRNYMSTAWWLTTFPGLALVAMVLAANRISQSLVRRTL